MVSIFNRKVKSPQMERDIQDYEMMQHQRKAELEQAKISHETAKLKAEAVKQSAKLELEKINEQREAIKREKRKRFFETVGKIAKAIEAKDKKKVGHVFGDNVKKRRPRHARRHRAVRHARRRAYYPRLRSRKSYYDPYY